MSASRRGRRGWETVPVPCSQPPGEAPAAAVLWADSPEVRAAAWEGWPALWGESPPERERPRESQEGQGLTGQLPNWSLETLQAGPGRQPRPGRGPAKPEDSWSQGQGTGFKGLPGVRANLRPSESPAQKASPQGQLEHGLESRWDHRAEPAGAARAASLSQHRVRHLDAGGARTIQVYAGTRFPGIDANANRPLSGLCLKKQFLRSVLGSPAFSPPPVSLPGEQRQLEAEPAPCACHGVTPGRGALTRPLLSCL